MKAIRFQATIPRFVAGLTLSRLSPAIYWSGLSCTFRADVPVPELPGEDWVMIQTRYGGICGSDLSVIRLDIGPYYAPYASSPFTLGHENVGFVASRGSLVGGWDIGERVVIEPVLWCKPRGFDELCRFCARGEINRCERFAEGNIAPGPQVGSCRDTGGSWSPYFVAHESQLYRVPDSVTDENALMVEPFAIGLHTVLQKFPKDNETVLIMGAGTMGLVTLAALRALGSRATVKVLARYAFQAEAATSLGASEVIVTERGVDAQADIAVRTGGRLLEPGLGKWFVVVWRLKDYLRAGRLPTPVIQERFLLGGIDIIYECVGSNTTLDQALHLTRAGGSVVITGEPGVTRGVNWTTAWAKEIQVIPAYLYHYTEFYKGKRWRTFDLALDLMARGRVDLGWMVTHRFSLDQYAESFRMHAQRNRYGIIKGVFDFSDETA